MSRLARFEEHRFIGVRDSMTVYDCDNTEQFSELEARVEEDDLVVGKGLQSFAPDTVEEARNRGFHPY